MTSGILNQALISIRCPYCVVEVEFRPMQVLDGGGFVCDRCGHSAKPEEPQFRCSCSHCALAAEGVALLREAGSVSGGGEDPREIEILHSINLLSFEEAMQNADNPEAGNRELEIKKELVGLYEQRKAFAHPTPAEEPAEYEPEELETWATLKERIDSLEDELAKMSGGDRERG